ncbi:hypothetical protein [Microbacterium sp. CR_7]|uniref:hypothetical protein n=1 Tax=Microbacterium sp. CR_7 TaxID=3055792 RepID=UPI0035C0DAA8
MAGELSETDKARVHALIANCELGGVFFHEQSVRRHEETPEGMPADFSNAEIGIQFRLADDDFGVRLRADIQNTVGTAAVVVSGEYNLTGGYQPTRRDVMMFANEVAAMTIYPYLREGVSTATAKVLGEGVLLPIAPRGAIAFDIDDDPDVEITSA